MWCSIRTPPIRGFAFVTAYTGLRLRDGAAILKVVKSRKAEQIRVIETAGFDPMRDGLEVAVPVDAFPPTSSCRGNGFVPGRRSGSGGQVQARRRFGCKGYPE